MSNRSLGLLLQSLPYLGSKKIFKVFTREEGLLCFFTQKSKIAPFSLGEWVYQKTEKGLFFLQDSTLLDPFLEIRKNYELLLSAGLIAQDLLKTQLPGKKSPELFDLCCLYFKKLSFMPKILSASFRLKLLLHEGVLSSQPDPTFSSEEWEQVEKLAFCRNLSQLQNLGEIPYGKINALFEERSSF